MTIIEILIHICIPSPRHPLGNGFPPLAPHPLPKTGAAPGEFQGCNPPVTQCVDMVSVFINSSGIVFSSTKVKFVNQESNEFHGFWTQPAGDGAGRGVQPVSPRSSVGPP